MTNQNLTQFGQHFLTDQSVVKEFLLFCHLKGAERVLEIGPGEGALTRELVKKAKFVTAVEIDETLKPKLNLLKKKFANLKVIYQNALDLEAFGYDLVCGALSYAIFEPLMVRLITHPELKRAVFLVSGEVKKNYELKTGRLYYLLSAFYKVRFSDSIAPTSFSPAPRAPGVILALEPIEKPDTTALVWQELWLQGDKKLKNSLKEAFINVCARQDKLLTQKESKAIVLPFLKFKQTESSLWQIGNHFLDEINRFIVYSKVC